MGSVKKMKRIKENIKNMEYQKLMTNVRGTESIRDNTKQNLMRAFTILFYTGLRLNEVQELRVKDIRDLLENATIKVDLSKTHTERKLYLTKDFKKQLERLFNFTIENDLNRVIAKGSNKNRRDGIHHITFIQQVNSFMRHTLGSGYTSHSFRQGLITEMGSKSINTKIISQFIGHSNVNTTMRYITPTEEDIINSLVR